MHTAKGFSVVNEADVFLKFPCFVCDPGSQETKKKTCPLVDWQSLKDGAEQGQVMHAKRSTTGRDLQVPTRRWGYHVWADKMFSSTAGCKSHYWKCSYICRGEYISPGDSQVLVKARLRDKIPVVV